MSNRKYSQKEKIAACKAYLSGEKSAIQIAQDLGMTKYGKSTVRSWIKYYRIQGENAFAENTHTNSYSKEFKLQAVEEYLSGTLGAHDIAAKYNIPSASILLRWVKKYNAHIELEDYDPKPEVYMNNTLKTTYEERLEIVKYCLANNRDIKGTAEKYGCKYAQLYQWVRKYEENGENALVDRRGKRKLKEELTELEQAELKIAQLEREKEEYRRKYELLKKAEQLERW